MRGYGLIEAALQPQDVADFRMQRGKAGLERQCSLIGGQGLGIPAVSLQGLGADAVRFGELGRQSERSLAGRQRLPRTILGDESIGKICVCGRALRIEPDGGCMGTGGIGQPALLLEEIAEIGVRTRMPWPDSDRPLDRRDRFVETAKLAQNDAEIGQRVGMIRPCRQGSPNQICCRGIIAEPVLDEAKMVQRRGMLRVDPQNAAQRRRSLGKPAETQMIGGKAELTRQARIAKAGRRRSLPLLRGPPLLSVHRSWPQQIGCGA